MKLKNNKLNNWINVLDMKDGQVAVIRSWSYPKPKDYIVQRYEKSLVCLGYERGDSWPNIFQSDRDNKAFSQCLVEVLPPGTELVL